MLNGSLQSRISRICAVHLSLALLFMSSGCATYSFGTQQDVYFTSEPSGASVDIARRKRNEPLHSITTPGTLTLKRRHNYEAIFTKQGYYGMTTPVGHKVAGNKFVYGNILWLGSAGFALATDVITGAHYAFDKEIHAKLVPIGEEAHKITQEYSNIQLQAKSVDNLVIEYSDHSENIPPVNVRIDKKKFRQLSKGERRFETLSAGSHKISFKHPAKAQPKEPNWKTYGLDVDIVVNELTIVTFMTHSEDSPNALTIYVARNNEVIRVIQIPARKISKKVPPPS